MNKEELINKVKSHFNLRLAKKDEQTILEFAQQYADAQTTEHKAEIERLKSENEDFKQCLVFTITCNSGADFEEMKHKAKKLLKLV